ncbi:MAG: MFS transporter [Candidatus Thorarchaeota archaeon SMTZ1-45]
MTIETQRLQYMDKLRLIGRDARLTIIAWAFWAFGYGVNDVLFNLYLLEAGFGEDFLGMFLSISIFLSGGLAILAGMVADRHSRKKILLAGYVTVFLGTFMQYSTLSPALLLISQLLYGIGYGFTGVCWQPYTVSVTTEEERVHVFSVRFAFFLIASLLGSLTGGFLPALWTNLGIAVDLLTAYRFSLWTALIPLAMAVLTLLPMKTDEAPQQRKSFNFGNVRNRGFIGKYALAWTVSGLGAGLFVQFFNVFFSLAFQADATTIGIIFAINTVVMAAGNFASPAIVDRLGKLGTIIWFQIFSIPFLLTLSWSPVLYIAIIGYVGRALFMNIAWPVMDVFYMEGCSQEERSTAMGVINAGDSLARGIGLNIGGWLLAIGLWRVPFAIAVIFYSLSIGLFYWFFGRDESGQPDS